MYTLSPTTIPGSEIVIVRGGEATGEAPLGATHVTATARTNDWPGGTSAARAVVFVMGNSLTRVPAGKAPAGTLSVDDSVRLDRSSEPPTPVISVDMGVPRSADGTPVGGGALEGGAGGVGGVDGGGAETFDSTKFTPEVVAPAVTTTPVNAAAVTFCGVLPHCGTISTR